jgi:LL-diaminopimelate aminotransferase
MRIPYAKKIADTGTYPFAAIDAKVAELKSQGVKVIDFGVGDPTAPTPKFVIEHLAQAANDRATSGYPSYIGELSYRQACADYLAREYNVTLDPKTEISSSIGSKEAIFHFPIAFVNPGDVVICPTPGYPVYKTGTNFAGGQVYYTPLKEENDFLIDLDTIPAAIAAKAKIIWTNYPNSPTGVTAPKEWLEELVAWAKQHNVIIAADEGCYNDIYTHTKPTSILEIAKEGIITFYSLSKRSNMTGYRVGFVAGDERIIDGFKRVKTNIDSGTPTFIQDAAMRALADTEEVAKMSAEYAQKRQILTEDLATHGLPMTTSHSSFYLWQKSKDGMSGLELADALVKIGIVATPGSLISDATQEGFNPGDEFIRFALVPKMSDIQEAARRIRDELKL